MKCARSLGKGQSAVADGPMAFPVARERAPCLGLATTPNREGNPREAEKHCSRRRFRHRRSTINIHEVYRADGSAAYQRTDSRKVIQHGVEAETTRQDDPKFCFSKAAAERCLQDMV